MHNIVHGSHLLTHQNLAARTKSMKKIRFTRFKAGPLIAQ
jgi:hypothetical protein